MYAIYITRKDIRRLHTRTSTLDEAEAIANRLRGVVEVFESGRAVITYLH